MRKEDKQLIKTIILGHMLGMMDIDQATHVTSLIVHDVVKDVEECADGEIWNDSDVRLAIGRVLIQRLSPSERKAYITTYTTHSGHDGELTTDVYINSTKERAEEAMRLCIGDIAETEGDDAREQDRLGKEIYESALPCRPELNQGMLKEVRCIGRDGNKYMVKIEQRIIKEDLITDRARLNTADEYEPLNVRITEEEYPIYYHNKLRELMDENGMTEEDARKALDGWEVTLELVYHTGYGGFAVEAEAVEIGTIYSPYNGTLCEAPQDEV